MLSNVPSVIIFNILLVFFRLITFPFLWENLVLGCVLGG